MESSLHIIIVVESTDKIERRQDEESRRYWEWIIFVEKWHICYPSIHIDTWTITTHSLHQVMYCVLRILSLSCASMCVFSEHKCMHYDAGHIILWPGKVHSLTSMVLHYFIFAYTKIHHQYLSIVAGEWMRVAIKFHHGRFRYVAFMFLLLNLMILVRLAMNACMHVCWSIFFTHHHHHRRRHSISTLNRDHLYIWLFIQYFNMLIVNWNAFCCFASVRLKLSATANWCSLLRMWDAGLLIISFHLISCLM